MDQFNKTNNRNSTVSYQEEGEIGWTAEVMSNINMVS
jgi:hypothetical protein